MTIRESLNIKFNDIISEDFGVINVNIDGGMQEDPFLPNRSVLEQKIRGRDNPYLMGVEYESLSFTLHLAFDEQFDEDKLRELANWLTTDNYAPLIFSAKPNHIYFAMLDGDGILTHNAASQGYVTVKFRCNSPWAYTSTYLEGGDFTSNTVAGTDYNFINYGDLPIKPLIEVEMISGTTFSIVNNSNGGEKLSFTGLTVGEKLTIDCENPNIETSIPLTYRFSNMSTDSVFLNMLQGHNYLKIYGNVKVNFLFRAQLRT